MSVHYLARKYNAADTLRQLADRIESGEFDAAHVVVGVLCHGGTVEAFGAGVNCDRAYEAAGICTAVQNIIMQG